MGTLHIDYDELRSRIALHLGMKRSGWTSDQETLIERAISEGSRMFYWPIDEKTGEQYIWSFMEADATVTLLAGNKTVDMPAEFSSLSEPFVHSDGSGKLPLAKATDSQIRALHSQDSTTGTPLYYAVRAKSSELAENDRTKYEAIFYPAAATNTTLSMRYILEPEPLSATNSKPLGGAAHSSLFLHACLAAADELLNYEAGERTYAERFRIELAAAIAKDRESKEGGEADIWPGDITESSKGGLVINKAYLKRRIGKFLGHGANPDVWEHNRLAEVLEILRCGLRRFYVPTILQGDSVPHQWSFLRPVTPLSLTAGTYEYSLPDDFAMPRGNIEFIPEHSYIYPPIKIVNDMTLRHDLQASSLTGRPFKAAYAPVVGDQTAGTTYRVLFYPIPDQNYEVLVPYTINPESLDDETSLPLGGQLHAETLIEACLAAAELSMGGRGVHSAEFERLMETSIKNDRLLAAPDYIRRSGIGVAPWESICSQDQWYGWDGSVVTVNGVEVP